MSLPNSFIYSTRILLRQFLNLSLPKYLYLFNQNSSKTIPKLVFAKFPHLICENSSKTIPKPVFAKLPLYRANLPALNSLVEWFYWLSPQNWKDTWPSGYKYPAHSHNIHSLASIHLLNSARRNSSRPPLKFLTSFSSLFSEQISNILEQPPRT